MSVEETAQARKSGRTAEVLELSLVDGLSIRVISKKLSMSRNTVRKILGRLPRKTPPQPELWD